MKSGSISTILSLLAIAISVYALIKLSNTKPSGETGEKSAPKERENKTETTVKEKVKEEVEIVHYMQRIQSFHAKLFYAGKENNIDLVRFYAEEIKEEMEIISEAEIFDEGVNISENMKLWGIRNINSFLEEIPDAKFNFKNAFTNLTNACNSCHQATKHPFIQIIEPTQGDYFNQKFSR